MPNCSKVLVDISFNNLIDVSSTVFIEELKDTDNMCVDQIAQTGLFGGRRCEERKKTCGNIPCVSKCCPPGQHYYISPKSCVSSERPFNPPIYNTSKAKSVLVSEPPEYGIIHGMKCRRYLMKYHETELDMNYLSLNGSLFVPNFNSYFSVDEYCLEDFYMPSRKMDGLFALICFRTVDSVQPTSFDIKYILIATGLIISCVFLLATLVVYLCLPTLQNLHGMTLMSHVSSFLVACVCLAAIQIGSPSFGSNNRACQTLGVVMLFGFLAAFAWMNMMCFDIWWTFGGMRSVNHGSSKRRERRRFAWYSLYAWGLPCVIIALLLTAEFVDGVPASIKPMFGMDTCWFPSENVQRDNYSKLMFFIVPVALLITCNVVLFVMTAVACNRVKAEISRMQKSSDDGRKKKFQADKNKLMMNGKLFIIMGVNWMIEVIGLLVPKMPTFWVYIPDTFNALQGVFIFAIFVMKPKVLKALADRLGLKRNRKETLIQAANNKLLIANDPRRKISTSTSTCFTTTTSANDNDRVDRV